MSGRVLLLFAALSLGGCYASNVVAPEARDVKLAAAQRTWRKATKADLPGFYASEEVTGRSAGALLKAYYLFAEGGVYSGAALVVGDNGPRFVVIDEDGRWTLDAAGLDLHDGGGAVAVEVAPEHLRLVRKDGSITFTRVELR